MGIRARRSRIRGFRASVVVTVAAGAAAMACGGTTISKSDETCPSLTCNPPQPVPEPPIPVTRSCPVSAPANETSCSYVGDDCQYNNNGCVNMTRASCVEHRWNVVTQFSSCNPPFPTACPASEPVGGTPCNHFGSACVYNDYCTVTALCENSVWKLETGICNPPPCPAELPALSEGCDLPGMICQYPSCESDVPDVITCLDDQTWRLEGPDCAGGAGGGAGDDTGAGGAG